MRDESMRIAISLAARGRRKKRTGWIEFHYCTRARQANFCGVPRALSAIKRLAFRELMLVGVNVTLIVQLAPRH